MNTAYWLRPLALATCLVVSSSYAHETVQCPYHPKEEWRPHTELEAQLLAEGWSIRRVEITSTCYEVYGKSPDGKRVAVFFDPKTFEQVEED